MCGPGSDMLWWTLESLVWRLFPETFGQHTGAFVCPCPPPFDGSPLTRISPVLSPWCGPSPSPWSPVCHYLLRLLQIGSTAKSEEMTTIHTQKLWIIWGDWCCNPCRSHYLRAYYKRWLYYWYISKSLKCFNNLNKYKFNWLLHPLAKGISPPIYTNFTLECLIQWFKLA